MNIVRRCKITICRLMSLRLLLQCQRRRIADQAPAAIPSQCLAFPFHDQPVPGLRHCRYSPDSRHSPCYSSCWRSSVFPHVPNTMIRALENIENGIRGRIRKRVFVKSGRETAHFFSAYLQHRLPQIDVLFSKTARQISKCSLPHIISETLRQRLSQETEGIRSEFSTLATGPRDAGSIHGSKTSMKPNLFPRWHTHTRLLLSILLRRLCETVKIY